jgi:hypothetical protein
MTLTHDDLKTLFRLLYQQQEELSTLTARLTTCERALQDVAALEQQRALTPEAGNGVPHARLGT